MMLDAIRLSIGTFTRFPVRPPSHLDRPVAGLAISLAPLTATVLGLLAGLPLLSHRAPVVSAVICLALLTWLTRGLHLDGLADTADALGSGKPAEQALQIARKSDIGPFGVLVLIFSIIASTSSLCAINGDAHRYWSLLLALVTSRVGVVWACTKWLPPARDHGLGATVAQSTRVSVAIGWTALVTSLWAWWGGAEALLVPLIACTAATSILIICRRRLGGVTGDVFGATIECAFVAALVTAALIGA